MADFNRARSAGSPLLECCIWSKSTERPSRNVVVIGDHTRGSAGCLLPVLATMDSVEGVCCLIRNGDVWLLATNCE